MRVIVIGAGVMGQNHARILASMGMLTAVVDIDRHKANALASQYLVEAAQVVGELEAGYDAAIVATPTKTHWAVAQPLLHAGTSVLVEKPLAATSGSCADLCGESHRRGAVLAVGHTERFNPVVRHAKEALRRGDFGHLISMSSTRFSQHPARIRDVGVVADLAIHDIDVMRYLAGSVIVHVSAVGGKQQKNVEEHALALLEFRSGVTAHIAASWLTPYKVRQLVLICSKKLVTLDYLNQTVEIATAVPDTHNMADASQLPMEYATTKVVLKRQEPLRLELEDFIEAVSKQRPPFITGKDGTENVRICKRILEAME